MKLSEIYNTNSEGETTIELLDPNGDDYAEVTISYDYDVEASEYEDEFKTYNGGAVFKSWKVKPFEYAGKHYTTISPELFDHVVFIDYYKKKNLSKINQASNGSDEDKKKQINDYLIDLFDTFVAPDISAPIKRYPLLGRR